jgi:hypothetical protein
MPSPDSLTAVYKDLADWHERQNQPKLRDQFLVLAADAAHGAGRDNEAERLRAHLLRLNPHHMLRPFGSFAEALCSPDVQSYVNELRRTYPPQAAQEMLDKVQSRRSPGMGSEEGLETLKVYDAPDETRTAAPPSAGVAKPAQRPARPAPQPPPPAPRPTALPSPRIAFPPPRTSAAPPAPPRPPRVVAERPPPAAPPREPIPVPVSGSSPDPEEAATGAWLSTGLFVLLVLAGVALTVFTLARPFVPLGWR